MGNTKNLKQLKSDFYSKIEKAAYVNSIKAECYFHIEKSISYDERDDNSLLVLSKDKAPIESTMYKNHFGLDDYKFTTGIKNIYPTLIKSTSNIKVKKTIYANKINKTLGSILGKTTDVEDKNKEYITTISKTKLDEIIGILDQFKKQLETIDTEAIKTNIKEKLKTPHVQVSVDQEGYWDGFGAIASERGEYYQLCNEVQKEKYLGFFSGSTVRYPKISTFLKYLENYKEGYYVYDKTYFINKDLSDILNYLLDEIKTKCDEAIDEIKNIKSDIKKISSKYKELEKKQKQKFKGNLNTAIASGNVAAANKAIKKLKKSGMSNKKINQLIEKYAKAAGMKVTRSAEVLSIYKKYKKNGKISGNLYSKDKKTTAKSSGKVSSMAATGATVAATKVKKATKKATKTNSKKIKSSIKNGVLTTVPSLASLKTMKKQLQNNTTVKISNIKTEANNRIADIEGKAEDEKKLAEIEKNNTIKQINEDAASKINAIDPNDSEASTKIENIQTEAENAIKNADEKYENRVNEIEAKKNQDVSQVENSRENDIKSVEEKSNKELKEINDDIEKAKKTKSSKKSVQTMAKTSSKATETKAETKEYKSNVSDNDVETSGTAADDSSTKVDEAVSNKQDEITAAEQAKENTSSSDSSANVAQPETTTSTPEQSTSTSVETDTSSNNTNYSTSGTSTSSNYNNSYDADESYSAGDYNTIEQQKQADINSSNTGVDQSTLKSDSTTKSTFDIKKDTTSSTLSSNKDIDDISSISSTKSTSSKKSSGLGAAVPIGLGIAATGAAAVAGVRYVKNKKLNEDYDENYDDENNDVYEDEVPSDSAYMADDYLGPEGSSYTEVPDDNEYTDAEALEEEAGVSDFSEDAALNELN